MLNVASSNSNNFVLTSEENHNRSKLSAKSKVQLKSNTFLQAKVPALNLPASTGKLFRFLLSLACKLQIFVLFFKIKFSFI